MKSQPSIVRERIARALDFRREYQRATSRSALPASLQDGDCLALSLILDLERPDALRVTDPLLASVLNALLGPDARAGGPLVGPAAASLSLIPFGSLGEGNAPIAGACLVYDVPSAIPFGSVEAEQDLVFFPLSQVAATMWRSRMGVLCSAGETQRGVTLLDALRDDLGTPELDPLFLLDRLNERRGGGEAMVDVEALEARCRVLERRVRELEMSGLARHQTLLADAVLRRKYGS